MGLKQIIYDVLMEGQPEKAIDLLLLNYEGGTDSRKHNALNVMFSAVKTMVFNDDRNRDPSYFESMGDLLQRAISREDQSRIFSLTYASLKKQHHVQQSRNIFLEDGPLDDELKKILPIIPIFYQFDLPPHIKSSITHTASLLAKSRQNKEVKPKQFYTVSDSEIETMVDVARKTISGMYVNSSIEYYNFIASVLLLSGRRNYEIQKTLGINHVPGFPYQATVDGICKKKEFDEEEFVIPLLCPYDEFEHAMQEIRNFRDIDVDALELSHTSSPSIMRAKQRLFGRRLTHTQTRNIYSQIAWSRRKEENLFMLNASKRVWLTACLCHEFVISATDCYDVMTMGKSSSP